MPTKDRNLYDSDPQPLLRKKKKVNLRKSEVGPLPRLEKVSTPIRPVREVGGRIKEIPIDPLPVVEEVGGIGE